MEETQIKTYLFSALKNLCNNPEFTIRNDLDIEWLDKNQPKPTEEEIQAEITRLQTEYDSKQYQRDRASEYPSIEDQLDDLYHNGVEGWKANIKAVKDAHPKGE